MKKILEDKGITLIALIITIIVLLILAGVTIAMLIGDNGILTQAQNAKTTTIKAEAEERVKLEVLGSYETNGKLDLAKLKTNIAKNITGATVAGEEFPVTVTVDGETFTIYENGKVDDGTGEETVTPPDDDTPGIVEGTREEWSVTEDGTLSHFKGTIPEDGTLVIPSVVDGINIQKLELTAEDAQAITGYAWVGNWPILLNAQEVATNQYAYNTKIKNIVISDGISIIGRAAFNNLTNLESIVIPESVTSIKDNAFQYCSNLSTVNYKGTQQQWNTLVATLAGSNEPLTNATLVTEYGK